MYKNAITMKQLAILTLSIVLVLSACKKPKEDDIVTPTGEFKTVEVQVIFPEGSRELDPSTMTISSLSINSEVNSSGRAAVAYNTGYPGMAFLLDEDKNVIMAGFISDIRKEISISTTTEFLLYLGLGTIFQPTDIKELFLDKVNTVAGIDEFESSIAALFMSNPHMLNDAAYAPLLIEKVDQLLQSDTVDIGYKSIVLNGNDIRSGIQLSEVDHQHFSITNYYRRRAHAFLYKTAYKDKDGKKIIVDDNISGSDLSEFDISVGATGALREVLGIISDALAGKGAEFAATVTDPIKLNLNAETESEAIYEVGVVGMGVKAINPNARQMTNAEDKKLQEIFIETFIIDFFLPIMLDMGGHSSLLKKVDEKKYGKLIDAVEPFLASVPTAYEAVKKGDFKTGLEDFMYTFYNNDVGSNLDKILAGIYNWLWHEIDTEIFIQNDEKITEGIESTVKILKAFDIGLKAIDYFRLIGSISETYPFETWEVKIKESKVSLSPQEATVITFREKEFTAIIKDTKLSDGQSFVYEWSTTGNYGIIKDNVGHEGTSFSSSSDKVSYLSELLDEEIPDDATDNIIVEVWIKQQGQTSILLNSDTSVVKINNRNHKLFPDGATIRGNTDLRLYLRREDGTNGLQPNSYVDYKIIWSTSGKYGLFNGSQTTVTLYDNNNIVYNCMDEDVEDATETFNIRIYKKNKEDSDWELSEDIDGSLIIDNDPNIIKYIQPLAVGHVVFGGPPHYMTMSYSYTPVPIEPDAVNYHVEVLEHYWGYNGTNHIYYQFASWTNDNYGNMLDQNPNEYQPRQAITTYAADWHDAGEIQARHNSIRGYGQVTIVLNN